MESRIRKLGGDYVVSRGTTLHTYTFLRYVNERTIIVRAWSLHSNDRIYATGAPL